jgi:adenylate cyclase
LIEKLKSSGWGNGASNWKDLMETFSQSKPLLSLVIALFSTVVVALMIASGLVSSIDRPALDFMFRHGSHPERADTAVVIAAIDQNSLTFFDGQQVSWPWPREFYSVLLHYLKEGGARAVIFDMDFSGKGVDESDGMFADSIKSSGNVVLTSVLIDDSSSSREAVSRTDLPLDELGRKFDVPNYNSAVLPPEQFMLNCRQLGVANYVPEVDGVARRIPLLFRYRGATFPQLALAGFIAGQNLSDSGLAKFLQSVPADRHGNYLINWYGKGDSGGVFKYYSISALIVSAAQIFEGKQPQIPPAVFKGKYVIVGGSAIGLNDFKSTPFTVYNPYPGMEIHATILSNFLEKDFMREAPSWVAYLLTIGLAFVVSLLFFRIGKIVPATLVALLLIAGYIMVAFLAFRNVSFLLPIGAPVLSMILGFSSSGAVSYVTEGRRRREMKRVLNRYLSPSVVDEVLIHPDDFELGGKELEATVFFSDIKNFTGLSEKMSPKELVENLNEYFTLACDLVLAHGGMLDKYIGDAIMAVFGAPLQSDKHALNACLAALEVQDQLKKYYSVSDKRKGPVFETRIGLNSGKMVIGNIGSLKRLDYTAIGDSVNLASRLEGVNKEFGTKIIISESTFEQVRDFIEARELDLIRVKGKQIPIRIYELIGEKSKLSSSQSNLFEMFHEGLSYYRSQKWRKASGVFKKILTIHPDDGPSKTYLARCTTLAKVGVQKDWDQVFVMMTK